MFFNKLIYSIILNLVLSINLFSMEDPSHLQYPDFSLPSSSRSHLVKSDDWKNNYYKDLEEKILWVSDENIIFLKSNFDGKIYDLNRCDEEDIYELYFTDGAGRFYQIYVKKESFFKKIKGNIYDSRHINAPNYIGLTPWKRKANYIAQPNSSQAANPALPVVHISHEERENNNDLLRQKDNNVSILNITSIAAALITLFTYSPEIKTGFNKNKNKIFKLAEYFKSKIKDISKKYVNKKNIIACCAFCGAAYYSNIIGKSTEFAKGVFVASCLTACTYKYLNKTKKVFEIQTGK